MENPTIFLLQETNKQDRDMKRLGGVVERKLGLIASNSQGHQSGSTLITSWGKASSTLDIQITVKENYCLSFESFQYLCLNALY